MGIVNWTQRAATEWAQNTKAGVLGLSLILKAVLINFCLTLVIRGV